MRHEIIAIPEIKTNIFNSIKIYFDEDFSEVLFPNNGPILELQEYIQTIFSKKIGSFREQVVFRSIPFLIAVFTEDKEIRISGTKLGQELFLCHHYDHADDPKFIAFKNHVTKIAMLSPHESISVTQKLTITKNLSDLNNLDEFQKVYDRSNE